MRVVSALTVVIGLTLSSTLWAQGDGFEGITSPYQIIEVATQETGIVKKVSVKVGDTVDKGQTIALLDTAMISASLAIAKVRANANANLDGATARYDASLKRLTTFETLASKGGARQDEVDQARSNLAIAQAEVDSQRESLAIAELEYKRLKTQLTLRTIKSPIDGVIVSIDREPGELVGSSQSIVARVAELDRLNLISHLPQAVAEQTVLGKELPIELNSGEVVNGVVEYISPVVDPRSATIEVKVLIDNNDGAVRSGMRATLLIDSKLSAVTQ